jgi:hypothetical protein
VIHPGNEKYCPGAVLEEQKNALLFLSPFRLGNERDTLRGNFTGNGSGTPALY